MASVCDTFIVKHYATISDMAGDKTYNSNSNKTGSLLLPLPGPGKKNRTNSSGMEKTIHDFRSSLNIIIGYSELMLDDVLGRMTPEQRDGLKDILTSSKHLLTLVEDMSNRQTSARL